MSATRSNPNVTSSPATSIWDRARAFVYDNAIVSFTTKWYREVLNRVPENSYILDVGIGTGTALIANALLLRSKNITVLGVDYDPAYVGKCRTHVTNADLQQHITVVEADIHNFTPPDDRLFDHVYFSASFMILPDQVSVLDKVVNMLVDREDGRIYFTQTFELQKNRFLEWLKPKLLTLTSIDFGNVSYEGDFDQILYAANVQIEEQVVIEDDKRVAGVRESRLICVRSKLYVPEGTETPT